MRCLAQLAQHRRVRVAPHLHRRARRARLAAEVEHARDRVRQRLVALLPPGCACACVPLLIDEETTGWVRAHVVSPCPASRLHVWRALKRRLYHYDAGVVAFRGFPRNYLLSRAQWAELLGRDPAQASGASP